MKTYFVYRNCLRRILMERKYTNRSYLDALEKKVLVFDGAMGTSLQVQNLTAEHFGGEQYNGCNDYLVISYPEAVEKVHRSFLEVGVDVLETDTFRSNRITMKEYGLQDRVIEINETAARLARPLADEYSGLDTPDKRGATRTTSPTPTTQLPITELLTRIPASSLAPSIPQANCHPPMTPTCPTSPSMNSPMLSASKPSDSFKAAWMCSSSKPRRTSSKSKPRSRVCTKPSTRLKSICRSRPRSRWIRQDACCSAPISTPRSPSSKAWALTSSVSTVPLA